MQNEGVGDGECKGGWRVRRAKGARRGPRLGMRERIGDMREGAKRG